MTGVLLFVVAEEAQEFIRRKMQLYEGENPRLRPLFLAERWLQSSPDDPEPRKALADGESFTSDFIGATVQECRDWNQKVAGKNRCIDEDSLVIADAQTARDGTVTWHDFYRSLSESGDIEPMEFPGYGRLPKEDNCWYEWRLDYDKVDTMYNALLYQDPPQVYPIYYGEKERLTNKDGIFDIHRADRWFWDDELTRLHDGVFQVELAEQKHPPTDRQA